MSVLFRRIAVDRKATSLLTTFVKHHCIKACIALMVAANILLLFYSGTARAKLVTGLYQEKVAVDSQSAQARETAMQKAMENVVVKVTGKTDSLINNMIKVATNKPAQYIKGYSYGQDGPTAQQLYLQITFESKAFNKLLREAGLAIWGAGRPTTLILLTINNGQGRVIQRDNEANPLVKAMETRFHDRALPSLFPLMDLEDSQSISMVDAWGFYTDRLKPIVSRYGAGALLVGRLSKTNNMYTGRLAVLIQGKQQEASVTDANITQLSLAAADLVGGALSSYYAVASIDSKVDTYLNVENVSSFKVYVNLLSYLKELTAVRSVRVMRLQLKDATVNLELSTYGNNSQLIDTIALGRRLQQVKIPESEGIGQNILYYRWK